MCYGRTAKQADRPKFIGLYHKARVQKWNNVINYKFTLKIAKIKIFSEKNLDNASLFKTFLLLDKNTKR